MKWRMIAGVILILAAAFTLYYRGVPYTEKNEMKAGPFSAKVETKEVYEIHPAVSIVVLLGGIALLVISGKQKS